MQNKKNFKFNRSLMMALFFVAISNFASNPQSSFAEITVSSYCQLTIQSMQQEISHYQERIALVNQYGYDPDILAQQEAIKRAEFDQARKALLSSYGTTDKEYVLYMGEHKQEVEKYLQDNSGVTQQIDDLSAQVNSLSEEYESLRGK